MTAKVAKVAPEILSAAKVVCKNLGLSLDSKTGKPAEWSTMSAGKKSVWTRWMKYQLDPATKATDHKSFVAGAAKARGNMVVDHEAASKASAKAHATMKAAADADPKVAAAQKVKRQAAASKAAATRKAPKAAPEVETESE